MSVMLVRTPALPQFHGPHRLPKVQNYPDKVVGLLSRRYLSLGVQCNGLACVRPAEPADISKCSKAKFVLTLLECFDDFGELFKVQRAVVGGGCRMC